MDMKFCGLVHEAVFEITDGPQKGLIVRLPFSDEDEADRRCPLIVQLLTSSSAKGACDALHQSLEAYLGADERDAKDVVTRAAAVVAILDRLTEAT